MKKLLALFLVASYLLTAVPVSAVAQLNPDGTVKTTTKKKTTTPKKKATTKKATTKKTTKTPKKPAIKKTTPVKKKTTTAKKPAAKKKTTAKKPTKPKKAVAAKPDPLVDQPQNLTAPDTDATAVTIDGDKSTDPNAVYDNGNVQPPDSTPQPQINTPPTVGKQFTFAGLGAGGALAILALIKKLFLH